MGQEYSWALRGKAKELYTVDGLTYEAVAASLAEIFPPPTPSLSQLKRWAKEEQWRNKKDRLRQDLLELEEGSLEFKKRLLTKALAKLKALEGEDQELDAQVMFGLVRVANVIAPKQSASRLEEAAPDLDRPALFLEDLEFIAQVLKEVDPEGLKILSRNFDLIMKRFKKEHEEAA
jgi:hypothetical protein